MSAPNILFEDADILVIDKPAGFVTNRADTTINQPTVQEWAEEKLGIRKAFNGDEARPVPQWYRARIDNRLRETLPKNETGIVTHDRISEFLKRGGVVHRLDKETSGVLIIAKNEESFINLQKQFKEGRVEKTYIALCHGEIKPSTGEINIPIGRLPWNRMRFGVLPQGREARSKYKVSSPADSFRSGSRTNEICRDIKYYVSGKEREPLSLVEVYPETGRTHQIRVHMQYIGHPIFADELYAGRKISKRDRKLLPRHFLHASKISFTHPKTGKTVEFESPLPSDLKEFLNALKSVQQ